MFDELGSPSIKGQGLDYHGRWGNVQEFTTSITRMLGASDGKAVTGTDVTITAEYFY